MQAPVQPIVLLADSQMLFRRDQGGQVSLMRRVRGWIEKKHPSAAYLSASNDDNPAFYDIFVSAMGEIGIRECRMVTSEPSSADFDFLAEADLVLLAGGDVRHGWRIFKKTGLKQAIIERYYGGAVLMGVSAGAVQLGLYGYHESGEGNESDEGAPKSAPKSPPKIFECAKLVPALIDVHDEPHWERLRTNLPKVAEPTHGIGIPTGGAAILHPDLTLEPVRHPLTEIAIQDGEVRSHLILPPQAGEVEDPSA